MSRFILPFAALLALAACDGPAVVEGANPPPPPEEETPDLPPGTENPTSTSDITRYEALDEATGSGYAQDFTYDAASDTFSVDNLAFDGANTYTRIADSALGAFAASPFRVYEAPTTALDSVTGVKIDQFLHRAIVGSSATDADDTEFVEFAIVRTGSYRDFGFGGFIYSREGGVRLPLPTTGQARYEGDYRGLRDFNNRTGIEYVAGQAFLDIDFEDFNDGDAVKGRVFDRSIFDVNGNDITAAVIAGLQSTYDNPAISALPDLVIDVGPGSIDGNGEITGSIASSVLNGDGALETLDTGKYYALLSGTDIDGGNEVVGIVVVAGDDPRYKDVTVRETGGFILTRP